MTELLPPTIYTYDSFGNVLTSTDPTGVITTNTYDALGRRIKSSINSAQNSDPLGVSSTATAYDPSGRIKTVTDALARTITNTYDLKGRLIEQHFADGTYTKHDYDAAGNCTSITDELGHTTRFIYDSRNRVIQTIYADGSSTSMRYDGTNRVIQSTDELGRDTRFKYDRAGRLLETTQFLTYPESESSVSEEVVSRNAYDHLGNLVRVIDADGNVAINRFDKLGRVIESRVLEEDTVTHVANPSLTPVALTTTSYDANGLAFKQVTYDTTTLDSLIPTNYVNPTISFESTALKRFAGINNQLDTSGLVEIRDGGRTLELSGDREKAVEINFKITSNTVLEFDFKELVEQPKAAQYYAIGVVDNLNSSLLRAFRLGGATGLSLPSTTTWSDINPSYVTTLSDGTKHIRIPLGQHISSQGVEHLVFINRDQDSLRQGSSQFANVRIYDDVAAPSLSTIAATHPDKVQTIQTAYDAFGRPIQSINADGTKSSTIYDAAGRVRYHIDELGRITENRYDQFGRLERTIALPRWALGHAGNPLHAPSNTIALATSSNSGNTSVAASSTPIDLSTTREIDSRQPFAKTTPASPPYSTPLARSLARSTLSAIPTTRPTTHAAA